MTTTLQSNGILFPDGTTLTASNYLFPTSGNNITTASAYGSTANFYNSTAQGYQTFPSGIIYQWGTQIYASGLATTLGLTGGTAATTPVRVTTPQFATPIKFPNAALQVVAMQQDYPTASTSEIGVVYGTSWANNATQTLLQITIDGCGNQPSNFNRIAWFAIGY